MARFLRAPLLVTTALGAVVTFYLVFTLPSRTVRLEGPMPERAVVGAYHVHSARSDGTGTVDEIAAAAARAGLQFVILTDHGDATREPDPPQYRHAVLVIDAVEISTSSGHLVALGLDHVAPYPLAGAARDVIEDVHRLGGVAVAAHPDSPNGDLRWRGSLVGLDGIEWMNADSEWRDERTWPLVLAAARSVFREPESIATLFDRPVRTLARWDATARLRPTFGLAALDAHARIGWREQEEPRQRTAIRRPSYQSLFRAVVQTALLDRPLTGDPRADAARVVGALAAGRSYSTLRAYAEPAHLEFVAEQGSARSLMGGSLEQAWVPTTFRASVAQAPGAEIVLFRDGREVVASRGPLALTRAAVEPGVYRVEVRWPRIPAPWIVSNPIRVGVGAGTEPSAVPDAPWDEASTVYLAFDEGWTIEKSPSSSGAVRRDENGRLVFEFALGGGEPSGQYAALVSGVKSDAGVDRIRLTARANRPMRLSLQVRLPGSQGGQRWRRSIYLDETRRAVTVSLDELEPADRATTLGPIVAPVLAFLLVADTLNSSTDSSGVVSISEVALSTRQP